MGYVNEDVTKQILLEMALQRWAADRQANTDARDALVRSASAAGISKHRIHALSAIARTTIDRILSDKE